MNRQSASESSELQRRYLAALNRHLAKSSKASLQAAGKLGRQAVIAAAQFVGSGQDSQARADDSRPVRRIVANQRRQDCAGGYLLHRGTHSDGQDPSCGGGEKRPPESTAGNDAPAQRRAGDEHPTSAETGIGPAQDAGGSAQRERAATRQVAEEVSPTQEHLRRLSHQILSAQEEERKRISRELHDEIGQTLTAINVKLATLKRESAISDKAFKRTIGSTQRLVEQSMNKVHRFARDLRPPLLDDLGLIPALNAHLKAFTKRTGIPVRFKTAAAWKSWTATSGRCFTAWLQEAFANIAKHAQASLVKVDIRKDEDLVRMEYTTTASPSTSRKCWAPGKPRDWGCSACESAWRWSEVVSKSSRNLVKAPPSERRFRSMAAGSHGARHLGDAANEADHRTAGG